MSTRSLVLLPCLAGLALLAFALGGCGNGTGSSSPYQQGMGTHFQDKGVWGRSTPSGNPKEGGPIGGGGGSSSQNSIAKTGLVNVKEGGNNVSVNVPGLSGGANGSQGNGGSGGFKSMKSFDVGNNSLSSSAISPAIKMQISAVLGKWHGSTAKAVKGAKLAKMGKSSKLPKVKTAQLSTNPATNKVGRPARVK